MAHKTIVIRGMLQEPVHALVANTFDGAIRYGAEMLRPRLRYSGCQEQTVDSLDLAGVDVAV